MEDLAPSGSSGETDTAKSGFCPILRCCNELDADDADNSLWNPMTVMLFCDRSSPCSLLGGNAEAMAAAPQSVILHCCNVNHFKT